MQKIKKAIGATNTADRVRYFTAVTTYPPNFLGTKKKKKKKKRGATNSAVRIRHFAVTAYPPNFLGTNKRIPFS
jgi:hypothetical protein